MSFKRLWAMFVARNLEFFRDRSALGWNFLFPFLIVAGFGMIYSRGNPTSLQKYKDNLYWTTLGLVIIFIAYALISYLLGILSAVSTTG